MTITGVDAKHIGKVLRMQPGDKLQIVSDDGVSALAEVASITESTVTVRCLEKLAESHEPAVKITLAQGLAKGEKMDFHRRDDWQKFYQFMARNMMRLERIFNQAKQAME